MILRVVNQLWSRVVYWEEDEDRKECRVKNFNQRVYAVVRRIPAGKVLNYGRVARLAGNVHASRAVGYALHGLRDGDDVPWQRVVFRDGGLAFAVSGQRKLLEEEGALFTAEGKVDMARCLWDALEIEAELSGL